MPDAPVVEIEHWTNGRLPPAHPLHSRWSILFKGKAILTFGSEGEARNSAAANGWVVAESAALDTAHLAHQAEERARASRELEGLMARTGVFECPRDGFRSSPIVMGSAEEIPPGVDAASVQIAEHSLLVHGGDDQISFTFVDMPAATDDDGGKAADA